MIIKVISLNMWLGGKLFPAILDFLKSQDADIVLLQEVHNGHGSNLSDRLRSMDVMRAELGYRYEDFAHMFLLNSSEGKIPWGNAVLSKFPISGHSSRYLVEPTKSEYLDVPEEWPIMPRLLQHVMLSAPSGDVNVFNVHGVWDTDGDNYSPARERMSRIIIEEIEDQTNVILVGDTNAKASNQAMRNLETHLNSVFGEELRTTFNMRRKDKPGYATAAVDLMYVSPSIKIISKDCPDIDISDHRPIIAALEIA